MHTHAYAHATHAYTHTHTPYMRMGRPAPDHVVPQEGSQRAKWADVARDDGLLGKELALMQEATAATSLTLEHLRGGDGDGDGDETPRTQLTSALLRSMDYGRQLDKAGGQWEVVRVGRGADAAAAEPQACKMPLVLLMLMLRTSGLQPDCRQQVLHGCPCFLPYPSSDLCRT